MILFLAASLSVDDLSAIKSEPNLERRSDLALDYAAAALDDARDFYNSGDAAKWRSALDDLKDAVELSYQSLEETGKNARNNKHFKHAELKTREFLRRLDGLRDVVGFEDREALEKIREQVSQVHDELLQSIMSRKK
jgi:hypothetical protein